MNPTIDVNTPFMQQLLRTNPALISQLGLTPAAPAVAPLTAEIVSQMIDDRIKASQNSPAPVQQLASITAQFEQVFQNALSKTDYDAFHAYVAAGSPGFAEMLTTDKLHPIAQLLWETIKENKK